MVKGGLLELKVSVANKPKLAFSPDESLSKEGTCRDGLNSFIGIKGLFILCNNATTALVLNPFN